MKKNYLALDWSFVISVDGGYGDISIANKFKQQFPDLELEKSYEEIQTQKDMLDISMMSNLDVIRIDSIQFYTLAVSSKQTNLISSIMKFFSKYKNVAIKGNSLDNKYGLSYNGGSQYDISEVKYQPTYPVENLSVRKHL